MIAEEIDNIDYIEYDLKTNKMTINYKDGHKTTVAKTIKEFLAFDSLLQSRGN